ncbi:MAG: hypothetical protein EPN48_17415 [Microbacteriaceae bacterium]|nr:MAG: hypothetical protein EPN48_17415 [Microbacteriaceae bacterium]
MRSRFPISVEVLRQEARDELDAAIEHRARLGEDPWDFLPELPTVDEQVVLALRAETIEWHELGAQRARAYHPAAGSRGASEFEYQLLRRIALDHPALTTTVWGMLGKLNRAA